MSKRFSLREYQQNVLDRLKAQTASSERLSTLGIQLGDEHWLVDMADISEVFPVPKMTAVPLTRHWYCGVANVRGSLYSVVDLSVFEGGSETPRDAQARVLLLSAKYAFNAGLLVSRVLGLRNTASWETVERADASWLRDGDGVEWRKLDVGSLLQRPEFLQIGL